MCLFSLATWSSDLQHTSAKTHTHARCYHASYNEANKNQRGNNEWPVYLFKAGVALTNTQKSSSFLKKKEERNEYTERKKNKNIFFVVVPFAGKASLHNTRPTADVVIRAG